MSTDAGATGCPACSATTNDVLDSRDTPLGRRRRRVCRTCKHTWSTVEVRADVLLRMQRSESALSRAAEHLSQALDALRALTAGRHAAGIAEANGMRDVDDLFTLTPNGWKNDGDIDASAYDA